MTTELERVAGELEHKRTEWAELYNQYPDMNHPEDVVTQMKTLNDEMTPLGKKYEELAEIKRQADENVRWLQQYNTPVPLVPPAGNSGTATAGQSEQKSLGELFTDRDEYKTGRGNPTPRFGFELEDVNLKTLMTTTAGYAAPNDRTPRVVLSAQRRPVVADLIPQDPTTLSDIRYMEETTFTNNAAGVTEGAVKPEAALVFTPRSQPVEVIATWLPVTNQQIDDVPGIQALINNRLTLMLELAEETALLTGSGTPPALLGFLNKPSIQTQARGADSNIDAIFKAMNKLRGSTGAGFVEPSGLVIHPINWETIRLMKTTEGMYIWGSPSEAGPERVWGMPAVVTPAITSGTGLTGDFRLYSHISRKMGMRIDVSDSHSDFFVRNQLAIRIEERLSLEILRAAAFCTITSLN